MHLYENNFGTFSEIDEKYLIHLGDLKENLDVSELCKERCDKNYKIIKNKVLANEDINKNFKSLQKEIEEREQLKFTTILEKDEFEVGFISESEKYFEKISSKYGILSESILINIYLKEINNIKILKNILYIISNLPGNNINSLAIIPIAAVSNSDDEIKELGVRCFESWDNPKYIDLLESIDTDIQWLNDYIQDVIRELKNK